MCVFMGGWLVECIMLVFRTFSECSSPNHDPEPCSEHIVTDGQTKVMEVFLHFTLHFNKQQRGHQ